MMSNDKKIAPLFPLPDTILFPGLILPLRIFEPRYRQMVRDLLDGPGQLVVGTVLGDDQRQLDRQATVQPIAGLGRLERYQEMPDGQFMIVLLGTCRVNVEPLPPSDSYPMTNYSEVKEISELGDATTRQRLLDALSECGIDQPLPVNASPSLLADIILMSTKISPEYRYQIYSTVPVEQRIEAILKVASRSSN